MIPTFAVVPTRYEPDRLRALLDIITPEAHTFVYDNGHEPPIQGATDARGMGLYAMWNGGWNDAREIARGRFNLAVLNDDIRILPGTLTLLATVLRADDRIGCAYPDASYPLSKGLPNRITKTIQWDPAGGRSMTGFCFVFKGELPLPPFDEGMEWWYGDSEFDESVKLAGYGVAMVDRVPIEHVSDAEANDWARRPELKAAVARDGERWARLHHEIVDGRWVPR